MNSFFPDIQLLKSKIIHSFNHLSLVSYEFISSQSRSGRRAQGLGSNFIANFIVQFIQFHYFNSSVFLALCTVLCALSVFFRVPCPVPCALCSVPCALRLSSVSQLQLILHQIKICPFFLNQLFMCSFFNYFTFFEDNDLVGILYCA